LVPAGVVDGPACDGADFMVTRSSCCKVNLLLNILGRREDGFHELESVMLPVPLTDTLTFEDIESGVELACSHPGLPVDERNLAWRAAARFLEATGGGPGIRIHLEKRLLRRESAAAAPTRPWSCAR
jgi:4-diphosphocytidyl-2-C-methyl-D-erythritol kinase